MAVTCAPRVHLASIERVGGSRTVPSMRLLLIRHGQTPSNVEGILDTGYPGPGLTALGHTQAQAVPGALQHETIAGLHVSRLLRTHETAAPLAAALGTSPRLTEGLEEIQAGDVELRRDEESVDAYQQNQASWSGGELSGGLPGGEVGHQFLDRYTGALRHIASLYAEDATVAVISHGAAIRVFASLAGEPRRGHPSRPPAVQHRHGQPHRPPGRGLGARGLGEHPDRRRAPAGRDGA